MYGTTVKTLVQLTVIKPVFNFPFYKYFRLGVKHYISGPWFLQAHTKKKFFSNIFVNKPFIQCDLLRGSIGCQSNTDLCQMIRKCGEATQWFQITDLTQPNFLYF